MPSSMATPPRDRLAQTASTSVQSSPMRSSAQSNHQPLSAEALLLLHANASDPKLAALEQAVTDRNSLTSQNSQLWKLIEKQRTGYNQILKELERVRGERDMLKAKLGSSSSTTERRHRSQERDKEYRKGSEDSSVESAYGTPERQVLNRAYSDDLPTPKSQPSLGYSRSQDPLTSSQSSSTSSLNGYSSSSSIPSPQRSAKSPLAPLLVPPRAESLPIPASATSTTPPDSLPAPRWQQQSQHPQGHVPSDSISSANSHPAGRPAVYARKHSGSESSQNAPPIIQTQVPAAPAIISTPQTAPPGYSLGNNIYTPANNMHTATNGPFPSQSSNSLLSALNESRAQALSRDSRITLPDEAKHYIANMGESPLPSPQTNLHNFPQKTNGPAVYSQPLSALSESKSEFLDMDEDTGDDDEDLADTDGYDNQSEPPPVHLPRSHSESPQQYPDSNAQNMPQHRKITKPNPNRAAVEDFPLPPGSTPQQSLEQQLGDPQHASTHSQVQAQMQADMQARQQALLNTNRSLKDDYDSDAESIRSYQSRQIPPPAVPLQPQRLDGEPQNLPASFRALPLLSSDLPHTTISVTHSFVRPNDRGKEVLSFVINVNPGNGKEPWRVEKMYSDVLALDSRVRSSVGKGVVKKIASLPEGKLWKDNAPAKVDQRKAVLEGYLQTLINLPVKSNDEVIAFFTSDIMRDRQPVMQAGHKEGYLTKRGKNFGGWKTRYFVLSGPVLEYFDTRGGAHLGSILVAGAQIGRQQKNTQTTDDEKEYRHAFLIVEAKKGPGGNHPRHVLCAESDAERDSWVEMLVRYFSGTYSEEPVVYGPGASQNGNNMAASAPPRSSTSDARRPSRGQSRDEGAMSPITKGPMSHLSQDAHNSKLFQPPAGLTDENGRSSSPSKSMMEPSPVDRHGPFSDSQVARRLMDRGQAQPISSSPLSDMSSIMEGAHRAASDIGNYSDSQAESSLGHEAQLQQSRRAHHSPERQRRDSERKPFHPNNPSLATASPTGSLPPDRAGSPEKLENKVKISGPLNGAPIPAGAKFGGSEPPSSTESRRDKTKSRSFWGFGRNGEKPPPMATYVSRAVFGVALDESLDVAQIASLPAIVFRCIQYLEAKQADQEEGIYRLSGSSAVIKSLKDRFNAEGDVDLLASDEYWDPHAIAGLLKSFLRELPASILTRDLHLRFLSVIDFVDPQERIRELSQLIASLPIANYSLLRALTAHLILIVQNSSVNKMTMRNVGIVFSPTLGIPAGVFSLMLGEFNRVFNVDDAGNQAPDAAEGEADGLEPPAGEIQRRNSRRYTDAAADELLGLSGRRLTNPPEDHDSGDELSIQEETASEDEGDATVDSSADSPSPENVMQTSTHLHVSNAASSGPGRGGGPSKAANAAAARGLNLNVSVTQADHRGSRMAGLPASPRPPGSPAAPPPMVQQQQHPQA